MINLSREVVKQLYDELHLQMSEGDLRTDAIFIDPDFWNGIVKYYLKGAVHTLPPDFIWNSIDDNKVGTYEGYRVVLEPFALDVKRYNGEPAVQSFYKLFQAAL